MFLLSHCAEGAWEPTAVRKTKSSEESISSSALFIVHIEYLQGMNLAGDKCISTISPLHLELQTIHSKFNFIEQKSNVCCSIYKFSG